MELFQIEVENAKKRVKDSGRDLESFDFAVEHLQPDPDGGGMFTARYEITCTNLKTRSSQTYTGGIGLDWVDDFGYALDRGDFG